MHKLIVFVQKMVANVLPSGKLYDEIHAELRSKVTRLFDGDFESQFEHFGWLLDKRDVMLNRIDAFFRGKKALLETKTVICLYKYFYNNNLINETVLPYLVSCGNKNRTSKCFSIFTKPSKLIRKLEL